MLSPALPVLLLVDVVEQGRCMVHATAKLLRQGEAIPFTGLGKVGRGHIYQAHGISLAIAFGRLMACVRCQRRALLSSSPAKAHQISANPASLSPLNVSPNSVMARMNISVGLRYCKKPTVVSDSALTEAM